MVDPTLRRMRFIPDSRKRYCPSSCLFFTRKRWRLIDALAARALTRRRSGDPADGSAQPIGWSVAAWVCWRAGGRARVAGNARLGLARVVGIVRIGSTPAATATPCGRDWGIGVRGRRRIRKAGRVLPALSAGRRGPRPPEAGPIASAFRDPSPAVLQSCRKRKGQDQALKRAPAAGILRRRR